MTPLVILLALSVCLTTGAAFAAPTNDQKLQAEVRTLRSLVKRQTAEISKLKKQLRDARRNDAAIVEPTSIGSVSSGYAQPVEPSGATEPAKPAPFDPGKATEEENSILRKLITTTDARQKIADYLAKFKTAEQPHVFQRAQLLFIHNAALEQMFPNNVFYVLRFAQWPVAFDVPEPLSNNNVFVVSKHDPIKLITQSGQLQKLFGEVNSVTNETRAKSALKAWLTLSQELAQDGMFQFSIPENLISIKRSADAIIATGQAVSSPNAGNSGSISAVLTFNNTGELQSVNEKKTLKAGMRPICQSTKLLDNDPIVRRMAEQDLLLMGKLAKPYLDEQRKKVTAPLQEAIDKIWQRILLDDR
jgi:hypothetical protein